MLLGCQLTARACPGARCHARARPSAATVFQKIVDIFAERYADLGVDSIAGFDARGFVLGGPIALALKKPFFMIRKEGKMPNTIKSAPYKTEYGERTGMCIPKDAVKKGGKFKQRHELGTAVVGRERAVPLSVRADQRAHSTAGGPHHDVCRTHPRTPRPPV